jgi:hypothetical protein
MRRRMFLVFVAGLTLAVLAAPAATAGGGSRPFEARMAGQVHWGFPGTTPSDCVEVTTVTDATGQALHLGAIGAGWTHCPAEPGNTADGVLTIVAANGDELHGTYDYDLTSESNEIPILFDGGTGRFAAAAGHVTAAYYLVPVLIPGCNDPDPFNCLDFSVPWDWWATLSGTISY